VAVPVPHLIAFALLVASAVLLADYLLCARRERLARRRRLMQRIAELGRERPTLNTRGRAP
jgi:hypothetical protein